MKGLSLGMKDLLPQPFAFLACMIAALLPSVFLLIYFWMSWMELSNLEGELERIRRKSGLCQEWQKREGAFLSSLKNPDHFYIDKHLETLVFLEPEMKKIEALLMENAQEEWLKKRLHFLKEGDNRLSFAEEHIRQQEKWQEVEERQQHPVEMNEEDLKRTLSLIEGATIWPYGPKENRPQLIIRDFQLSKKELPSQENVFVIQMHLIKRENSLP